MEFIDVSIMQKPLILSKNNRASEWVKDVVNERGGERDSKKEKRMEKRKNSL